MDELEAMKAIDGALTAVTDTAARKRVLTWAWEKFAQQSPTPSFQGPARHAPKKKRRASGNKPSPHAKAQPIGLVKDLNLKPRDAKSLDQLVGDKQPKSLYEKCTIAVHYLQNELSLPAVSASHVYTCFKHMKWKLPTNLGNTLSYTASHYGWLDSRNMQNITVTAIGENLVEHDLPRAKRKQ